MARHGKTEGNAPDRQAGSQGDGRRLRPHRDQNTDAPIGLTEAFAPVGHASADDQDDAIGLTEAFAPVSRYEIDIDALQREARAAGFRNGQRPESARANRDGSHAGGFSYQADDGSDEYPDAFESLEPTDTGPLLFEEEPIAVTPQEPQGSHGKSKQDVAPHQRKSLRMRKILIVIIVLLFVLIGALGYFMSVLFQESSNLASRQAQDQAVSQETVEMQSESSAATDASTKTVKKTDVPDLVGLLGMTQDQAVEAVGRGATVTTTREVDEEGNPVKTSSTVALNEEPADSRSGTPTVYLSMDKDGKIVEAGYSAASATLGYGSLSFVDAVKNEHIVERTLAEAGVSLEDGTAQLPDDKAEYSTYDTDGTTLLKESYSFSGTTTAADKEIEWSSVLLYDYSSANASGNLADTIRIVYAYVSDVAAMDAALAAEAEEKAAAEAAEAAQNAPAGETPPADAAAPVEGQ